MICISIAEKSAEACIKALEGVELAEIRLDAMDADAKDIERIFSMPAKLIATCRAGECSDEKRHMALLKAIESGASFVDIELEAEEEYRKVLLDNAKNKGCKVIISHHDFEGTPGKDELEKIVKNCFESGADIAKIACKVNSEKDNARLLGLLGSDKQIVVIGMGEKGRITRLAAPLLGSPFTFAALGKGKETAEGQMTADEMKRIYGMLK